VSAVAEDARRVNLMPQKKQKKSKDALDHLDWSEYGRVLCELLDRHEELRGEANEIADRLLREVSVEAVAEEVVCLVQSMDVEDLADCAGKQPWGYVNETEAARELLEESLLGLWADMKRTFEAGKKDAAERICQGILIGLMEVDETGSEGLLELVPGFPEHAADWTLSTLLELYPQKQRKAAGNRLIKGIEKKAEYWVDVVEDVVSRSTEKKQDKRR
jgi:hypothetical protein